MAKTAYQQPQIKLKACVHQDGNLTNIHSFHKHCFSILIAQRTLCINRSLTAEKKIFHTSGNMYKAFAISVNAFLFPFPVLNSFN